MAINVTESGISIDADVNTDAMMANLRQAIPDAAKIGAKIGDNLGSAAGRGALKSFRTISGAMAAAGKAGHRAGVDVAAGFKGATAETIHLVAALQKVTDAIEVQAAAIRRDRVIREREMTGLSNEMTRQTNLRLRQERSASAATVVEIQRQTAAARSAASARLQSARFMYETLGRLERGLGVTIAGTARTITSGVSRAFSGLGRTFQRQNTEINRGFSSSLTTRESTMRSSFSRQERLLSQSITRQSTQIQRLNQQVSRGVLGAASGRGAGGGVGLGAIAGGAGIVGLLTSGFTRFSDLERLNKQFLALTDSAAEAAALMAQVKEFAKITPFDLVGVADLAKGFLTIGTAAEDVIPQVTAIADAVAFTGGGVPELDRIRRAIGQVVSAGRLQGDELNQLSESLVGINITKLLADQITGGDTRKLLEMKEAGEITADIFVEGLITGLQQDQRLVGASEDIAKTLGGRVANLKESFADFGASLIGLVAGPLKQLISGTQLGLQGLSDFIKGEGLGPALETLRTALFGAAAGLSAVIAAKGAVEVFRLLATTLALVATPFGAVLTVFGLLGAATAVLARDLPEVRLLFDNIRGAVAGLAAGPINAVQGFLSNIAGFFVSDRSKAVARADGESLTLEFVDGITAGLETRSPFAILVQERILPALRTAVDYVRDTLVPALVRAGRVIADVFQIGIDKAGEFVAFIKPHLQPAIDGFRDLASALGPGGLATVAAGLAGFAIGGPLVGAALAGITLIGTRLAGVFSGSLGDVRGGVGSAAAGLGTVLGNLASTIREKLAPIGETIAEFFRDLFSGPSRAAFLSGFLNVIEEMGRILGSFVSSPGFVTAVAAIAAGAALIAARFVIGFGKGVIDNVPELAVLIQKGLGMAFKAALDADVILLALAGFASLKVIGAITSNFRKLGEGGANGFTAGFRSKLGNARGFLQGFGGTGSTVFGPLLGEAKSFQKEIQATQNQLRVMGSNTKVDVSNLTAAKLEAENLGKRLSEAQLKGLAFRDSLTQIGNVGRAVLGADRGIANGLRQIGGAFLNAGRSAGSSFRAGISNALADSFKGTLSAENALTGLRDLGQRSGVKYGDGFRASVTAGMSTIKSAITGAFTDIGQAVRNSGGATGAAFVQGLKTAAAAGLAGFGGFVAGQAEGRSGGSGVTSAIGIGLAAGLATANPLIGAAAGGMALLGAAIGRAKKDADDFKNAVKQVASSLSSELKSAVDSGVISVDRLRRGLEFKEVTGLDTVEEAFAGLDTASKDLLISIDATFAKTLLPALRQGNGDLNTLEKAILKSATAAGLFADEVSFEGRGLSATFSPQEQYSAFFTFIEDGFNALTLEQKAFFEEDPDARALRSLYADIAGKHETLIGGYEEMIRLQKLFGDGTPAVDAFARQQFNRARGGGLVDTGPNVVDGVIESTKEAITEVERLEIALDRVLNPGADSTLQQVVDRAVLSLRGSFDDFDINEAGLVQGGGVAEAGFRESAERFRLEMKAALEQGIAEGTIVDQATAYRVTAPILASLLDTVTDPEVRAALEAQFTGILVSVQPVVEEFSLTNLTPFDIPVSFDTSAGIPLADQSRLLAQATEIGRDMSAGVARGLRAGKAAIDRVAGEIINSAALAMRGIAQIGSPSRVTAEIGGFLAEGVAVGISRNSILAADAARGAVREVTSVFEDGFGPVPDGFYDGWFEDLSGMVPPGFYDDVAQAVVGDDGGSKLSGIGRKIGTTIADAIAQGAADKLEDPEFEFDLTSAVSGAFDAAIELARSTGNEMGDAMREGITGLFGSVTGTDIFAKLPGNSFDLTKAVAAVTIGKNSLLESLDSNITKLFDINARGVDTDPETAPLSASERDIFGENGFSLDVADVLGALNVQAFSSVFDDIANLGETLLAQGRGIPEVTATLQAYINDIIATGAAYGFSGDQLRALADSLGLSEEALNTFLTEVDNIGKTAAEPGKVKSPTPTADLEQIPTILPRPIINNLYLPTGDPEAVALAVSNRQAYASYLPGG